MSLRIGVFHQPASVNEAVALLGEGVAPLVGGTDLCVNPRFQAGVREVVDLGRCGMSWIRREGDWLSLGAATTMRDIAVSDLLKAEGGGIINTAAEACGSPNIRNAASIGGNCASGLPSADTPPALLALDAVAVLAGAGGRRSVPLASFFEGPGRTALRRELLVELRLPATRRRGSFQKLGRTEEDIALVNAAVALGMDGDGRLTDVRVVAGAVAPVPWRCRAAEQVLEGQTPEPGLLARAAEAAAREVSPISDHRASEGYRRRMCGVLVRRALEAACVSS
ncbi:MAG: FAD binding domain-containing protein [Chloroflexota bacterium]